MLSFLIALSILLGATFPSTSFFGLGVGLEGLAFGFVLAGLAFIGFALSDLLAGALF